MRVLSVAACVTALLLVVQVSAVWAVSSITWRQREQGEFGRGTPENVSLSADGSIRLSPKLDIIYEPEQPYLWALALDDDGTIYASGGNEGIIYRIAADGQGEVFYHTEEAEVQALAVGPGGTIYAGTSPGGRIYKIEPDGLQSWTAETGEEYIWSLVVAKDGTLYAGTGMEGRVIRLDRDGNTDVFFDSAETHIRTLALDGKGNLLAGSDGHGLIFRISPEGEGFVVYDAPLDEVVTMFPAADGTIYASVAGESGRAVMRGGRRPAPHKRPAAEPQAQTPPDHPPTPGEEPQDEDDEGEPEQPTTEQRVGLQMEGKVLAISTDGYAREVWSGSQEIILSLEMLDDGDLLMGSSAEGRLYALDGTGQLREVARAPSSQVTALARRSQGRKDRGQIVVAGSNLGSVGLMYPAYTESGTLESRVLDARAFASWGRISWRADQPSGTSVVLQARSGNTEEPDRTWTDWSGEMSDANGTVLDLPSARFLQWRAMLRTERGAETPVLREVAVTYLPRNLPPEFRAMEVQEPGVAYYKVTPASGQGQNPNGGPEPVSRRGRRPGGRRAFSPGAQSLTWQATDPNGDDLLFDVYYKAADEKTWKQVRERIDEQFVTLDTTAMPDGTYLVRVVATDDPSNPPKLALNAEVMSEQFDVDNTPPRVEQIKAKLQSPTVRLTFEVSDTFSIVRSVAYSIDAGDWVEAPPEDGLNDAQTETYDLTIPSLPSGEHSIVVRATDAAGNVGAGKALVEIP